MGRKKKVVPPQQKEKKSSKAETAQANLVEQVKKHQSKQPKGPTRVSV